MRREATLLAPTGHPAAIDLTRPTTAGAGPTVCLAGLEGAGRRTSACPVYHLPHGDAEKSPVRPRDRGPGGLEGEGMGERRARDGDGHIDYAGPPVVPLPGQRGAQALRPDICPLRSAGLAVLERRLWFPLTLPNRRAAPG